MAKKIKKIEEVKNNASEEINEAESTKADEIKQDFASKIATKPVGRIHVVAKSNHGTFNKGEEYEISENVFKNYKGIFEILDK